MTKKGIKSMLEAKMDNDDTEFWQSALEEFDNLPDKVIKFAPKGSKKGVEPYTLIPDRVLVSGLSNGSYRLFVAIKKGLKWESSYQVKYADLAEELKLSRRQIINLEKQLVKAGLIEVTKTGRGNIYRLVSIKQS